MKADDPNFIASVYLMNARDAIQKIIDGFEQGFDRFEYIRVAMTQLGEAAEEMYKIKSRQAGHLQIKLDDMKEEMREQEMGDDW